MRNRKLNLKWVSENIVAPIVVLALSSFFIPTEMTPYKDTNNNMHQEFNFNLSLTQSIQENNFAKIESNEKRSKKIKSPTFVYSPSIDPLVLPS